jgi:hypothetical protein
LDSRAGPAARSGPRLFLGGEVARRTFAPMYIVLVSLVIGLFVAMLFVNLYFRIRVLKAYKVLVQNEVDFKPAHIFNLERMRSEIIPQYPHLEKEILAFAKNLRFSIQMATVLIALITAFGGILMWYRN